STIYRGTSNMATELETTATVNPNSPARRRWRPWVGWLAVLVIAPAAILAAVYLFEIGGGRTPAAPADPAPALRLDQGWDADAASRYHHESQGTKILPLSWFLALERPLVLPTPAGRLADRDYLSRFGFNYEHESKSPDGRFDPNHPELPVGF